MNRKYEEEGEHWVDIEVKGTSQRGEVTIPGTATLALPSKVRGTIPAKARLNSTVKLADFVKTLPPKKLSPRRAYSSPSPGFGRRRGVPDHSLPAGGEHLVDHPINKPVVRQLKEPSENPARKLEFGIRVPGGPGRIVAFSQLAEALDFDYLACGEHVMFRGATTNAFITLATAASVTRRIKLLSAITLLPLYPAVLAAKLTATLAWSPTAASTWA